MTKNARQQTHNCIDKHNRGNRAVGEHVIADGNFEIDQVLDHAMIHAFVMTANDDEMRFLPESSAAICWSNRRPAGDISTTLDV